MWTSVFGYSFKPSLEVNKQLGSLQFSTLEEFKFWSKVLTSFQVNVFSSIKTVVYWELGYVPGICSLAPRRRTQAPRRYACKDSYEILEKFQPKFQAWGAINPISRGFLEAEKILKIFSEKGGTGMALIWTVLPTFCNILTLQIDF